MRFIGYDSIQTRWFTSLSNSYNNVASVQKNRADKSHRVIVALLDVWGVRTSLFIDLLFW